MYITVLRYEKKVNLGNYESESLGIEIALSDQDNPNEALTRAKQFVHRGIR